MGVFDVFQIPYSALEREHEQLITDAAKAGAGTIIRGGVARAVPDALPAHYSRLSDEMRSRLERSLHERQTRWQAAERNLADVLDGMPRMEFLLRFTLSHPDVHTVIVGTSNPAHLDDNIAAARKGELPPAVYEEALARLE
jgi:aryl-alcohol dehydrogenase-like predicted oxidoreductase